MGEWEDFEQFHNSKRKNHLICLKNGIGMTWTVLKSRIFQLRGFNRGVIGSTPNIHISIDIDLHERLTILILIHAHFHFIFNVNMLITNIFLSI